MIEYPLMVAENARAGEDAARPRGRHPQQDRSRATKEALLLAALDEFATRGFDGASTRAIAEAAGAPQPQINYHFASKEDLWKAGIDHLFQRTSDAVDRHSEALLPANPTARDRFATLIRAFVHAVAEVPELNRIMVQESTSESDRLRWLVDNHTRPFFERFSVAWDTLRRDGAVAVGCSAAVAYYAIVGASSLPYVCSPEAHLFGVDTDSEEFITAHADALIEMIFGASTG